MLAYQLGSGLLHQRKVQGAVNPAHPALVDTRAHG